MKSILNIYFNLINLHSVPSVFRGITPETPVTLPHCLVDYLCSCINLLACVLNVLVVHAPDSLLAQQQSSPEVPLDTLKIICGENVRRRIIPGMGWGSDIE